MARRFLTNIDLTSNAIQNALLHPQPSDPSGLTSAQGGQVWFNSSSGKLKFWNGTTAIDLLDLAAATGTLTASKISDLAATIVAYRLDQFAAPTAAVSFNSQRITNVANPSTTGDAANKSYVDAAISSLTNGLVLKGSVRVATSTNVSLSSPGGTIDGVTMATNDVILLMGQTTASQNGPWVWTGASSALTRPANYAAGSTATPGAFWDVREGSSADLFALLTTDGTVTVDTTSTAFVIRGSSTAGATSGYGTTVSGTQVNVNAGTGISVPATPGSSVAVDTTIVGRKVVGIIPASTAAPFSVSGSTVTVNHALNNSAVAVTVRYGSAPPSGGTSGAVVELDHVVSDANNVVLTLPAAPGANNYVVSVVG